MLSMHTTIPISMGVAVLRSSITAGILPVAAWSLLMM